MAKKTKPRYCICGALIQQEARYCSHFCKLMVRKATLLAKHKVEKLKAKEKKESKAAKAKGKE